MYGHFERSEAELMNPEEVTLKVLWRDPRFEPDWRFRLDDGVAVVK
jgi:hypothetical protein